MGTVSSVRDERPTQETEDRERVARRAARAPQRKQRSVGADVLTFPLSRVSGSEPRFKGRAHGRGTTVRRVQDQREQQGIPVRAAVYTQDAGLRERVRIARRWGTGTGLSMWHVALVGILLAVLMVVAMVGPLRSYYVAWRDAGVLQVEYETLSTINEGLSSDVERLNTVEGIEDEARRRGYVYPGEESLVVDGLEEESLTEQAEVQEALDEYNKGLPWYVHTLDGIFGYKHK